MYWFTNLSTKFAFLPLNRAPLQANHHFNSACLDPDHTMMHQEYLLVVVPSKSFVKDHFTNTLINVQLPIP